MSDPLFTEEDIIFKYTDEDGIADGILMPVSFGSINIVTDGIIHLFSGHGMLEIERFNSFMTKAAGLLFEQQKLKEDWFYSVEIEGKKYFIAMNGSNGFTMMLPEEY